MCTHNNHWLIRGNSSGYWTSRRNRSGIRNEPSSIPHFLQITFTLSGVLAYTLWHLMNAFKNGKPNYISWLQKIGFNEDQAEAHYATLFQVIEVSNGMLLTSTEKSELLECCSYPANALQWYFLPVQLLRWSSVSFCWSICVPQSSRLQHFVWYLWQIYRFNKQPVVL